MDGSMDEWQQIEIAIELDKGKSIRNVARQFKVSEGIVSKICTNLTTSFKKIPSTVTRKRIHPEEKEWLLQRIREGELLENLTEKNGVTLATLRRWCCQNNIPILRNWQQLSAKEKQEVEELLQDQSWEEIAHAYSLHPHACKDIHSSAYQKLEPAVIGFLFELLQERPRLSNLSIVSLAQQVGLSVNEKAVTAYRKRLKRLQDISIN